MSRAGARGEFPGNARRDSLFGPAAEDDAMRPRSPAEDGNEDLFRSRLANILDPRHELLRLAALVDWGALDAAFGPLYAEAGRPGLATRLLAGLRLLKHAKGLSDEQVCAQWVENPYFQAFCGEAWFRHRLPLDRSSMTRWRRRSEEHTSELQSRQYLVCRLLLEKKKTSTHYACHILHLLLLRYIMLSL